MDKRLFLAFTLSGLVIVATPYLFPRSKSAPVPQTVDGGQQTADSGPPRADSGQPAPAPSVAPGAPTAAAPAAPAAVIGS
ncbi:hypothetical protein FJY94_07760, partial [Candidatus Kaiserbacteria bacterium]|nr:hypothetical protein [Candidatus Kaiserbacteria bacterium]